MSTKFSSPREVRKEGVHLYTKTRQGRARQGKARQGKARQMIGFEKEERLDSKMKKVGRDKRQETNIIFLLQIRGSIAWHGMGGRKIEDRGSSACGAGC